MNSRGSRVEGREPDVLPAICRKFLISAFLLLTSYFPGCATIEGRRTPDGTLTIRSTRFFWTSQKVDFSVKDGTNNVITFRVSKSSSDSEALSAVTEAAIRGAVHGVIGP